MLAFAKPKLHDPRHFLHLACTLLANVEFLIVDVASDKLEVNSSAVSTNYTSIAGIDSTGVKNVLYKNKYKTKAHFFLLQIYLLVCSKYPPQPAT